MIELINDDNLEALDKIEDESVDLVYADMIYEDKYFFHWVGKCYTKLKSNGVFIVQTDYHSVSHVQLFLESFMHFVNWVIYKQEWGGVSRRSFPKKHDDILIYAKSRDYKFYYDRILIPKKTAGT